MRVVATDTSQIAVEFQNSEGSRIDSYVETYDLGPEVPGGSFRAMVHDFRTPRIAPGVKRPAQSRHPRSRFLLSKRSRWERIAVRGAEWRCPRKGTRPSV